MRERSALVRVGDGRAPVSSPEEPQRWRRRAEGARSAPVRVVRRRPWRALALAAGVLSFAAVTFGAVRWAGADGAFAERLSGGCEELGACQQLEAEALRRLQSCWLGCGSELGEHRMARSLRYRAEERSAVREHYRERDAAERDEQRVERERRLADRERQLAEQAAQQEREQRERLELERLRQDRIDRRIQEERQRRVAYLALLTPPVRAQRLERCHADKAGCEPLLLDLIEAAAGAEEKRQLAQLNERLLQPSSLEKEKREKAKQAPAKADAPAPNS
jgi:hypothetical protein